METKYTLISYNQESIDTHNSDRLDDILSQVQDDRNSWIIIRAYDGSDRMDIERLLAAFSADTAFADKILDHIPREFSDKLPTCLYIDYSVPTPVFDSQSNNYVHNRGSVVLGEGYLLLFDETMGSLFDKIQHRVTSGQTRAQDFGVDYVLYLLFRVAIHALDDLIDIELANRLEDIEDEVIANPGKKGVSEHILTGRKLVKPLYESIRRINAFLVNVREEEYPIISAETRRLFTKNLAYDIEAVQEGYLRLREWTTELLNIHRTNVGERTNRIIFVLTILTATFVPSTFISSVFGMNFEYMPVLQHPFGYYGTLLLMLTIATTMLGYMKIKGWFQ